MSVVFNLVSHRELIENLVLRDIKARYKQSVLGISWAIVNPLVTAIIYSIFGRYVLKQETTPPFPVFAYFGLLFWILFSTGVTGATESLVAHMNLITKIYFPREVFPIAAVVGKGVDFLFGLIGMVPLLFLYQVVPSPAIVLIVPLLLIQLLFTAGLGLLFSCANLFYRDVRHVIALMVSLWIYVVPNLYPLERVPERLQPLYLLNPMAAIIDAARRLAFAEVGGEVRWPFVGIAAVVSVGVFLLGYRVFKRYEPRFAEAI